MTKQSYKPPAPALFAGVLGWALPLLWVTRAPATVLTPLRMACSQGLVQVQDWGSKNLTFPFPSAKLKIVPKPSERTLKPSLASEQVPGAGFS